MGVLHHVRAVGRHRIVVLFAGVSGIFGGRSALGAEGVTQAPTVTEAAPAVARRAFRLPVVGVGADVGLPDGAMASLVLRPLTPLRLSLGVGSNSAAPGFRAGVSLLPFGAGPSITVEGGHYLSGRPDGPLKTVFGGVGRFASYVGKVNYTFANAHAGIDVGRKDFTIFAHAGVSYIRATLRDVVVPMEGNTRSEGSVTTLTFREDPVLRMFTPSVKLGLVFYLQ
ncbi:MAG TPA: hypothetical protein VGG33_07510 [Polyangia bacterium]